MASDNMFSLDYQLHLNDLFDLSSVSLSGYVLSQQYISTVDKTLNAGTRFEYNRHQNKMALYIDWLNDVKPDDYLVVEVHKIVEPTTYTDVYNDIWLKKYLTSLIKKQWGTNLMKFEGMQLPGGLTFNGREMFTQAEQEIQLLEQEVQSKYELPPDFLIG